MTAPTFPISKLRTNTAHIQNGGWVPSEKFAGLWLKLRGNSSTTVTAVRDDLLAAAGKPTDQFTPEEDVEFFTAILARATIVDWNLTDEVAGADGKAIEAPIPCTEETRFEWLSNPDYADLRNEAMTLSLIIGKASFDAIQADAGN